MPWMEQERPWSKVDSWKSLTRLERVLSKVFSSEMQTEEESDSARAVGMALALEPDWALTRKAGLSVPQKELGWVWLLGPGKRQSRK